ncbi:fluoride efflux transporter FluC [Saccharopolyspora sp. MS10]|uniref:fluoride efflux transporter FluC n=1 Tax=Saccharopolyspora sp. MS10 TaxID=3385973 RepID=UPI0039A36544
MANDTADVRSPARRRERPRARGAVLAAISLGGGLGALARHGLGELLPTAPGGFPWSTFGINALGCLLIGVLMVLITEVWTPHPLVRPFFGVGVLGGFTTFSAYAVEFGELLRSGEPITAAAYLAGTLLCALLAVLIGVTAARWATGLAAPGTSEEVD